MSALDFRDSFADIHFDSARLNPSHSLLIFDQKLARLSPDFLAWSKKFPTRYAAKSGEALKELEAFPVIARKLAKLVEGVPARRLTVVAVGGGSIGDFAGFFASIYKRGVRLIHVPSTWLASIDSSHGGKTALNNGRVKNQFGTFYPAERVILVRSLLMGQPRVRALDAMGELAKIALIDGGAWTSRLARATGDDVLWQFLKPAIKAKLDVVDLDPREEKGLRQILNLGHTVGHVFETQYGWTHGKSVAQGLYFAIDYSEQRGLNAKTAERARQLLKHLGLEPEKGAPISAKRFVELAQQDKKRSSIGHVTFIFLRAWGDVVREEVSLAELTREAQRQGLVR